MEVVDAITNSQAETEKTKMTEAKTEFKPQEIQFRKVTIRRTGEWQRKVLKTQAAYDKFVERFEGEDSDWEFYGVRDAEGV